MLIKLFSITYQPKENRVAKRDVNDLIVLKEYPLRKSNISLGVRDSTGMQILIFKRSLFTFKFEQVEVSVMCDSQVQKKCKFGFVTSSVYVSEYVS